MKRREFGLGAVALAVPGLLSLPAQAQSGKGYIELKQPAPVDAPKGQVEVIEFFSYGCVHCMRFAPLFDQWMKAAPKDVAVRLEHVSFQSSFEPLQRLYYGLLALGQEEPLHEKIFKALQVERVRLDKPDVAADWVAKQGVDRAKFEAAYKSFGVATRLRRAVQLQEAYQVEGTPALGIAGRYYTDGSLAGGFERMLQITNELIERERKRG